MKNFIWLLVFIVSGNLACLKNEQEQIDVEADKAYFPLQVGKFLEYEVDSILFQRGKFLDSTHTLVREEITSKVQDSLGDLYIILRSNRKSSSHPWIPSASYTARLMNQKIIRNESNLHFIKLVFPIRNNQSWNGLALIQQGQVFNVEGESIEIFQNWEPFKIKELSHAEKIGSFNFNEVVTVLQTDEEDLLSKRFSLEKYARGVGLVYRESTIFDCISKFNDCNNNLPWRSRATKGFILRQTIIRYN